MKWFKLILVLFLYVHRINCDWASDWMAPIQKEIKDHVEEEQHELGAKVFQDQDEEDQDIPLPVIPHPTVADDEISTLSLRNSVENTLHMASKLADNLRQLLHSVTTSENVLKTAIVNGRFGVSTVKVSTMSSHPRSYIVRDGRWSLCNGMLQVPSLQKQPRTNVFDDMLSQPKCVGQEIPTKRDPCAFNSVTRYETIPEHRRLEYMEDQYLCVRSNFNNTLEQYLSVPRQLINITCRGGLIRSLDENIQTCGIRTLAEYTFYPQKSSEAAELPLEYCTEPDNSCKLIVAWHVSNATVENYYFLKNEENFPHFFIKQTTNPVADDDANF